MSPQIQKFFAMGEEDYRNGEPFHSLYDTWSIAEQHAYEDGRLYKAKPRRKSK
jgi:hypothetical protein